MTVVWRLRPERKRWRLSPDFRDFDKRYRRETAEVVRRIRTDLRTGSRA